VNVKLVLASASPRRRALIGLLGLDCDLRRTDVDESLALDSSPIVTALNTAELKSTHALEVASPGTIVLAADTVIATGSELLGKPRDNAEAAEMLRKLRGRRHYVHTAIVLARRGSGIVVRDVASTAVEMRQYGDEEIDAYVATGDPLDKAGSYAIQHPIFTPVKELHSCYAAVVGLPLCHVARALALLGTTLEVDVPESCQQHHNYDCPISGEIVAANR